MKLALPTWNNRAWGTAKDPIRQSALNAFASQEGCGKRFKYERDAEAQGLDTKRTRAAWKPTLGTAVHATIERALGNKLVCDAVLAHRMPPAERIDSVLADEMSKAAGDLQVDWHDDNPTNEMRKARWMVIGALRTVAQRVLRVIAVEAPFVVEIGGYHTSGTIDLIYEPREAPGSVDVADWKTGERRAAQAVLDHGYQVAIYGQAIEHGTLFPGTEREMRLASPVNDVFIVQLREYVSLERMRAAHKALSFSSMARPELETELARKGWQLSANSTAAILTQLGKHGLATKSRQGKEVFWRATGSLEEARLDKEIWHRSRRAPDDVARLIVSLKNIVGTVRMGRFIERLGEQCSRCQFRMECLNAGHEMAPDAARELNDALSAMDLDGLLPEVA